MASFYQVDPFTQIHQALWTSVTNFAPWAALVRPGARINDVPSGTISAKAVAISPGDVPELRIIQSTFRIDESGRNVATERWQQTYMFQLSTASMNVIPVNQLKFLTIVALKRAPENFGLPWVYEWLFGGNTDKEFDAKAKLRNWVSYLPLTVWMNINRQDLDPIL